MDCEKFEPLLLDELYEELDEVTSAAVKRHVSGCARCGALWNGMRSTRRSAALVMLELPAGLEDRILSSVKEAQKVVPIQSRASRALSWAGSWAMRPQTAMAAVFLLMIGTSAFVIRARNGGRSAEQTGSVSVTENGEPAGQAAGSDDHDSLDNKAAAAAHGANIPTLPPPAATAPPSAAFAAASNGDPSSAGIVDGLSAGKGRAGKVDDRAIGSAIDEAQPSTRSLKDKDDGEHEKKVVAQRANAPPSRPSEISNAGVPAGAPYSDYAPSGQAAPLTSTPAQQGPQDGYSAGMAAYRARNFSDATRQFDSAARSGDQNAALWAAKSVKDGNGGCAAAQPRFDAVASRSAGTWLGNEATLESARCQITTGALDSAREKLTNLTAISSHAAAAQQALSELNQVAAKANAKPAGGGGAGHARPAPAPRAQPAKPSVQRGF